MMYQLYYTLSQAQHNISLVTNKTTRCVIGILFTVCLHTAVWAELLPYDNYEFDQDQKKMALQYEFSP